MENRFRVCVFKCNNLKVVLWLHTKAFPAYGKSHVVTACCEHVWCCSWNCAPLFETQWVHFRGTMTPSGWGVVQWVHHAEGPEGFPQEELLCPKRVIKMEVCFDKEPPGHFFPTELASTRLPRDTPRKKKPDMFPKNLKIWVWCVPF